ncbi:UTP--glucose-1-phosphate uridylyltransferase, partial [Francisella tularensis subsp. holarctica]|nr:UTP--glucose-1-phosphate uridylyltransferase [Francisella tularensis subsp. holarctica]
DDLIYNDDCGSGKIYQLVIVVEGTDICGCRATQQVKRENTNSYGKVAKNKDNLIKAIIEKTAQEKSQSTNAVVGRYILTNN